MLREVFAYCDLRLLKTLVMSYAFSVCDDGSEPEYSGIAVNDPLAAIPLFMKLCNWSYLFF